MFHASLSEWIVGTPEPGPSIKVTSKHPDMESAGGF